MKFGTNTKVNARPEEEEVEVPKNSVPEMKKSKTLPLTPKYKNISGFEEYVVAGVLVSVVTRYVIRLI